MNSGNVTYFDSFGVEYIPKQMNNFLAKNIKINISRIQVNDSRVCEYFRVRFITLC